MVAIVNNAKKKQRQAQNSRGYQTRQSQQTYQRNVSQQQYQQMSLDMTQMRATMTAKQQELKSRLQQKYPAQRPVAKGDILSRAAANTSEHNVDELELRASEETLNCVANIHNLMCIADSSEESCLMKELNDLMLMGYQADLSFERDFLSEGIDMLNRYEIPGV